MGYANRNRGPAPLSGTAKQVRGGNARATQSIACPGFLSLISGESVTLVAHPSYMNYIWWITFGVFLIPVLLIGVALILYGVINVMTSTFVVTNKRVVIKTGLLNTNQTEVRIEDIRGVNLQRGLWQRIIGTGNIMVGTAATGGAEIVMAGVGDPDIVMQKINSMRQG